MLIGRYDRRETPLSNPGSIWAEGERGVMSGVLVAESRADSHGCGKPRLTALSTPTRWGLLTADHGSVVSVRVRVACAVVKGFRGLPPVRGVTRCLAVGGRCRVCEVGGPFTNLMTELRPHLRRKEQAEPCADCRSHQKP